MSIADSDLLELQCRVVTECRRGVASAYCAREEVRAFLKDLKRFSAELSGECRLSMSGAGDGRLIGLRFYPLGRLRRIAIHVRLAEAAGGDHRPEEAPALAVEVGTEASFLDSFMRELSKVVSSESGTASLGLVP